MRSTGTGSDPVFAHATPHSGPCAVLPPHDDVPHRTDRGHFTIAAETSPAPTTSVGLETSAYALLIHPPSPASSTVQCRASTRSHTPLRGTNANHTGIFPDNDAHGCAADAPCRLQVPTRKTASAALSARRPSRRCIGTGDNVDRREGTWGFLRLTKGANMCADYSRQLDAFGAAIPYRGNREVIPTTAVLAHAQAKYHKRFPAADGRQSSPAGALRHSSTATSLAPRTHRPFTIRLRRHTQKRFDRS